VNQGQASEPRLQRRRLGGELRQTRALAGLSGRQLSELTGISQPTVSRMERGESVPSLAEVARWADAAGVTDDRRALLFALTEAAVNEVTTFRTRLAGGLAAVQDSVRGLEATARTLRNFQPGIVPGLLQTAEYARRIMGFANTIGDTDIGAAVAARLARQQALHDPDRRFEFLMTEAALRFRPGPQEVLTAQLDHLAAVVTLAQITFGVIPADAEMHAITRCGFVLYEHRIDHEAPFAVVETPHASVYASEPADFETYRNEFARFANSAVYGAEALDLVRRIAHPIAHP
jgi:transcriptional regulator with XRE-family HTH domain